MRAALPQGAAAAQDQAVPAENAGAGPRRDVSLAEEGEGENLGENLLGGEGEGVIER